MTNDGKGGKNSAWIRYVDREIDNPSAMTSSKNREAAKAKAVLATLDMGTSTEGFRRSRPQPWTYYEGNNKRLRNNFVFEH